MHNGKTYELRYLPLFYEELDNAVSYIAFKLKNDKAAADLLDNVENAILNRLDNPEGFETILSKRDREHPF